MSIESLFDEYFENQGVLNRDTTSVEYKAFRDSYLENPDKNLPILLKKIRINLDQSGVWSFIKFLQNEVGVWGADHKEMFKTWLVKLVKDKLVFNTELRSVCYSLFCKCSPTVDEINLLLGSTTEYLPLEHLALGVTLDLDEWFGELAVKAVIKVLWTPKWNFIGLGWRSDVFKKMASWVNGQLFLQGILEPENQKAFVEFLEIGTDISKVFFESLPNDSETRKSAEAILNELLSAWKERKGNYSPYQFYIQERSDRNIVFITHLTKYISRSGGSIVDIFLPHLRDQWFNLWAYIGDYIDEENKNKFEEFINDEGFRILIEIIRNLKWEKGEHTKKILLSLQDADKRYTDVLSKWKVEEKKQNLQREKREKKILEDIEASSHQPKGHFSAYFISQYKRYKDNYTEDMRASLKTQLLTFFSWDLLKITWDIKIEVSEDGSSSQIYWLPYASNYLLADCLEIGIELWLEIGKEIRREALIRSFFIVDTETLERVINIFKNKLWDINTQEADEFLDILIEKRNGDLTLCWGWQNHRCVFESFKKVFLSPSVLAKTKKTFLVLIWDDYFPAYQRNAAAIWARKNKIFRSKDLKSVQKLLYRELRSYTSADFLTIIPEYGWVVSELNHICISLGDSKAIKWRFEELLKTDVCEQQFSVSSGGRATLISETQSEINFDKYFLSFISELSIEVCIKYLPLMFKRAAEVLDENSDNTYWGYLLKWVALIKNQIDQKLLLQKNSLEEIARKSDLKSTRSRLYSVVDNYSIWEPKKATVETARNIDTTDVKKLEEKIGLLEAENLILWDRKSVV